VAVISPPGDVPEDRRIALDPSFFNHTRRSAGSGSSFRAAATSHGRPAANAQRMDGTSGSAYRNMRFSTDVSCPANEPVL
jgi:hypothetical protein